MVKIYHNSRCRKSREGLAFLESKTSDFEIIEYLKTPLSFNELKEIISKLGIKPLELIRKQEADFKENFKGKDLTDDEYIQAMVDYPKLIERPIVVNDEKAVLGRPTDKIGELF
jgi:arsenate reductase